MEYVRQHGTTPRYRGNRLIFLAPDHGALARLRDCIRSALAWNSIVEDVTQNRLVLDNLQAGQAKTELKNAEDVLPRSAREAYKWLLCPGQAKPTDPKPTVEAIPLNTGGSVISAEIERTCLDNEWIIQTWSPVHLRTKLIELYWKADKTACGAMTFWEDTLRYLYLPRLKNKEVLAQAIIKGAGSRDFYGRYRRADLVVSMRVHSMSPSIGLGVPMVPLVTQDRMTDFLADIGLADLAVDAFAADLSERLYAAIIGTLDQPKNVTDRFAAARATMRTRIAAVNARVAGLFPA